MRCLFLIPLLLMVATPAAAYERPLVPLVLPRLSRENAQQLLQQAKAAANATQYDEAEQLFTRAINTGDLNQAALARAYTHRGNIWLQLERPHQALADFRRALELAPSLAAAYRGRAKAWQALGLPHKSMQDLQQAKEIEAAKE